MPPDPTPTPVPASTDDSQSQALSCAADDADTNAGSGDVGDPVSSCQATPTPTPTPLPADIAVHVQDPLGNPVSGASVEVIENGLSGTTDSNGDHDFGNVPPGSYTVKATLQTATASLTQNAPSGTTTQYILTLPWTLIAQWVDTQAYCGDYAKLEVGVVPVPPPASLTVEVLHPSSGATIATFGSTLTGGSVQFAWMSKAQTASWRTDKIGFRVTVSGIGLSGNSTNQFTIRPRPTVGWTTLENNRGTPAGFSDVYEYVDASLEASQVHYSLKIELSAEHFWQSMPWDDARQATEKSHIETIWNNGFSTRKFHRIDCRRGRTCDCAFDCCKAGFHLDVNFVSSGEHYEVEIRLELGRCATGRSGSYWNDPSANPPTQYAHEVGHMLGNFDEYSGGATDPNGVQPAVAPAAELNLMSTGMNSTLLNRHYRWVLAYLNAQAAGDTYEIIPP
jgi:hypothetical protein